MNSPDSPAPPVTGPAWTGGSPPADLMPWLAAVNGLALAFLTAAVWGGPLASPPRESPRAPAPPPEIIAVDLASAAAGAPPAPSTAGPVSEPESAPAEIPPNPWREMPEMIEALPVEEPPPRPIQEKPVPSRSIPKSAAAPRPPPSPPRTRPAPDSAAPGNASNASASPNGSGSGNGNGAAANAGRAGSGTARGVTPDPPYPAAARRDRVQGTVLLRISVRQGIVTGVDILRSSGSALLDQSTVSHVQRRWRWPATTTQTFTRPITFRLSSR